MSNLSAHKYTHTHTLARCDQNTRPPTHKWARKHVNQWHDRFDSNTMGLTDDMQTTNYVNIMSLINGGKMHSTTKISDLRELRVKYFLLAKLRTPNAYFVFMLN